MRWLAVLALVLAMCFLIGCADKGATQTRNLKAASGEGAQPDREKAANAPAVLQDADKAKEDKFDGQPTPAGAGPSEPVARKKIATGRIELSVETFDTAVMELKTEVKLADGYLANSDDTGASGGPRVGTYTVRVPAREFDRFMDAVGQLGAVRRRSSDVQDITDQYYDTAAHIKNDEVRRQGLQKLYDITAQKGRIEDLLVVDRELSNVTGRIDEQKGRLNRWDKQVAYSTVVVQLNQRTQYEAVGTPSFGTTIERTWNGSLEALATFGKVLLLIAVAAAPWLGVFAVLTAPLWIFVWRHTRKSRAARPTPPSPPAPPMTALPA